MLRAFEFVQLGSRTEQGCVPAGELHVHEGVLGTVDDQHWSLDCRADILRLGQLEDLVEEPPADLERRTDRESALIQLGGTLP